VAVEIVTLEMFVVAVLILFEIAVMVVVSAGVVVGTVGLVSSLWFCDISGVV
jgi:hypothetical protein